MSAQGWHLEGCARMHCWHRARKHDLKKKKNHTSTASKISGDKVPCSAACSLAGCEFSALLSEGQDRTVARTVMALVARIQV